MRGLHVHVGSQILAVEPFADSVAPLAALGEFEIYDLGGGLGSRYTYADEPPTIAQYLDALIGAAQEHLPAAAEIIIEPGRSMVARPRYALPRRLAQARLRRRRRRHGRQPRSGAVRPALRGGRSRTGWTAASEVHVVGRHCESGDVLVDGVAWSTRASATCWPCR